MTKHLDNAESCFVCRRRADGLGVNQGNRIGWLCQQCADGGYGMKAIRMSARSFDEYEARAVMAAGERAGAYLDDIGQTDLAKLDPANWAEFCKILIEGFGDAIRREVGKGVVRDGFGEVIHAHKTDDEIEAEMSGQEAA
ncbi:DUF6511 domain-containing protein [Methylobacterium planeticum]|uniref:Uncharacterized protein n=1 Tax=Methylobacterium planeticum TaxID=2615211 RepID=A0A6N6MDU2_9HYPH|nr:DUF6511 domain-containing protein [Methylobacterium planeticum]KAB1068890.1 hypothetical protein F6X51_26160 [Methylobacterium planeticum]